MRFMTLYPGQKELEEISKRERYGEPRSMETGCECRCTDSVAVKFTKIHGWYMFAWQVEVECKVSLCSDVAFSPTSAKRPRESRAFMFPARGNRWFSHHYRRYQPGRVYLVQF